MLDSYHNNDYVLITGGAGYVGSHTCLELLKAGYKVIVIDYLSNASEEAIRRVRELSGKEVEFRKVDIVNKAELEAVFNEFPGICSVIHLAGLKAVGESSEIPLPYYQNNITGTLVLLEVMKQYNVRNIVFSSSATVYGNPPIIPIPESSPTNCTNPYARTKLFVEEIIRDVCASDKDWNAAILRYFNPVGAHNSGLIGEDPRGVPNNLMPYIAQVAVGRLPCLRVFGGDYPTKDGTSIRDYIHVVDLALGHLAALEKLNQNPGCVVYNLGSGVGSTVLDMVKAFSTVVGRDLPYKIVERRAGDVTNLTALPELANKELNWKATRGLEEICADLWRWQNNNPYGYASKENSQ
ncbi:UDP-glucose-4-epimerase [Basidiobolus ranarum]|uniref:UDP-glucose 4-epimerase n=1 Tax=Basidiobolus ranarum TaxID=34480 RepID=A0ABR2W7S4_9FUNG